MPDAVVCREVAESAWSWVLGQVRGDDGPWLPARVPAAGTVQVGPPDDRDGVYDGIGGLALVLAEIGLARPWTDQEGALAAGIGRRLAATSRTQTEPSLFDGLAGDATALRTLATGSEDLPLRRLRELGTPAGWPSTRAQAPVAHDMVMGTAGVVLAGAWVGSPDGEAVAAHGAHALLAVATETGAGLDWSMAPGREIRMPNYSHGTAGIATALAVTGHRLGRTDLVEAARLGAEHLVSIGDAAGDGFRLPHYVPHGESDEEPVTYSWCHGPTGTSYLFAALDHAGVPTVAGRTPADWRRRCLHAVTTSGVPDRLRPGFWDNDGRCCGTAGVGDAYLDACQDAEDQVEAAGYLAVAQRMGGALVDRAVTDEDGTRWRFLEHRADPPLLDPGTGWMQGAAGIAAFLLRLARVTEQGPGAEVVDRPDQWWAVPAAVRTSGRAPARDR
jgi:lantibiotic modifying enzyme